MGDVRRQLDLALAHIGRPSSDYDLNLDVELSPKRTLRPASVLMAVSHGSEDPRILLTKRASSLKHHPGQIAFPGGKVEEADADVISAALREAEEEIGLEPGLIDVIGTLPAHETVTGFTVTPVVGILRKRFDPILDEGEVAEVFDVPLKHVMDTGNYSIQSRRWRGETRHYFTVPWGPYYIWGATARILRALADRMSNASD